MHILPQVGRSATPNGDQRDKVDKFGARVRLQITALGGSDRALTMEFRFVLFDSSDG